MAMLLDPCAEKGPRFWIYTVFVLIILLPEVFSLIGTIPADCSLDKHTLYCSHSIPRWVPSNVSSVYIRGYNRTVPFSFINDDHSGWDHVTEFDITIDKAIEWYAIGGGAFSALRNMNTLGIHGRNVGTFSPYVFKGLDNLDKIDLSGCMYLEFQASVLPSLTSVDLPKLSSLSLAEVESGYGKQLVINEETINFFIQKPITNLNMSGTNIFLKDLSYRRSTLITHLDVSNITVMSTFRSKKDTNFLLLNLKTIFVNDNDRYNILSMNFVNEHITHCDSAVTVMLENIYASKVTKYAMTVKNTTIDISNCRSYMISSIRTAHFRFNHIQELDAVLSLPENNITEVDISHNDIRFISPMVFKDTHSLKYLYLAHNRLHQMEHSADFGHLLKALRCLEDVSIAHNHLTIIPHEMFSSNSRLRIIDLSGNYLETVDFRVDHMTSLTLIDLKGNRIKSLPEQFRNELIPLLHKKEDGGVVVDLDQNVLECSCQTKDFIKWMLKHIHPSTKRIYHCAVDGRIKQINGNILKEIDFLCIRLTVIISCVVSSCFVVAVVIFVVVYAIRKFRKKQQHDMQQRYLEAFRDERLVHGGVQVKFIAFLSHSSKDVDIVNSTIFEQLDTTFKEMTNTNRSTVCMGDRNFMPGFSIIEQAMQCLEKSCAAIVIISDSFCRSQWCEMELKEAYQQQKPIVPIFLEIIDENLMSPILLNIFKRQVRATLHNRNGEYVLEPSWEVLCEAVVSLASMHHKDTRGRAETRI